MTETIFQVQNVVKIYKTGAGGFTALKGVSFDVQKGEFLGIIGKSGAGKTTLLNMLSGVSQITSGKVLFTPQTQNKKNGDSKLLSIGEMSQDELSVWRGHNMGIVYQSFELLPQLNLVDNIMLPQEFAGKYQAGVSRERALALLDIVELSEHANKLPAHISGGQKQRVAIARALVNDPSVIVADEPTGSLDTVTANVIFDIFAKLVDQGKTVIMVTHDMDLAERFSRTLLISDGELVDELHHGPEESAVEDEAAVPIIADNGHTGPLLANLQTSATHDISKPAVSLKQVVKTYVNAAGSFTALKGVDLEIEYGQFVAIVGKSGSGKSTLLNMLTGIDHPTSGHVEMGGEDIYSLSESKRALWRGKNVGIVFQFFQLLPTLTLLENTILPMDYCNVYPYNERPKRAMELLKMVGLEDHIYDLPANVSNGQQQAAAIARSIATDPSIIVADEPTGNLDSRSADVVIRVFQELADLGKTILLVTHDPSLTSRVDRTVIISDGEIIEPIVASTLPSLDHPQMLHATHKVEKRIYDPGEVIIRQGEPVDYFYMVGDGEVEIMGEGETAVSTLTTHEFFGEVELMGKGTAVAAVRAGCKPTKVALLPKDEFFKIMNDSPETSAQIMKVAAERRAENQARRQLEVA
ncbi:MAG: ATP-binding cassette domain-containing protein [Anaerolineae bacterium]|nr:ATP-binding cassette domain-containing protein [Anaerolineae bacterium]